MRASVSAIIVTRGDVPFEEPVAAIRESGVVDEILVWGNDSAVGPNVGIVWTREYRDGDTILATVDDLGVYGRYVAIEYARGDLIYVQDDDCVIEPDAIRSLVRCWESDPALSGTILANMPLSRWADYPDSGLVGWGTVFHRDLPRAAFARLASWLIGSGSIQPADPGLWLTTMLPPRADFVRCCDVAFTTLTPHRKIDLGFRHLPWAETPGRMFTSPGHAEERGRMLALARAVRDNGLSSESPLTTSEGGP